MAKHLLCIAGIGMIMILIELWAARNNWPKIKGWLRRAVSFNAVHFIVTLSFSYIASEIISSYSLLSLNSIFSTTKQIAIGYLSITFVYYWWHRVRHSSDYLWRAVHQLHHSPSRLEVITSFYKHPHEMILNSLITSILLNVVLGIDYYSQVAVIFLTAIAELFYHWNIKTPYWIGFIIQRPESHCVHHQYNLHHYNYSDLPIWDILFGTFYNPKDINFICGFGANRELQLNNMMMCKDVNRGNNNER